MSDRHKERAKLLLLRKRIALTEAPYVVIARLGGLYDDAFMLVLEAVQDGSLNAEKKPEVQWDFVGGFQEVFQSVDAYGTTVATRDLLAWLDAVGGSLPDTKNPSADAVTPLVPSMLNMADVMADSGYTEEQVFDLGISSAIIFLVVVPLMGACRVPVEALSHFMAGDDDYTAEGMPEHYSGALSGRWTIKRERLRILPATWDKWVTDVEDIQALCERQAEDATPSPAPALVTASDAPAILKNRRPDLLTPLIQKAQRDEPDPFSAAVIWPKLCDMAELKTKPFIGKTESGLKWIDAHDDPQFFTKDALGDRLRRQKKPR